MLYIKRNHLLFIVAICMVVLSGCGKEDNNNSRGPGTDNPDQVNPDPNNINISANLTSCDKPFNYRFEATLPASLDQNDFQYEWNFGDGGIDTGKTSSHAFITAGDYNVTFRVRDSGQLIDSGSLSHSVSGCAISGTIKAQKGSEADSDINNKAAPYAPNDQVETAQSIRNPVIVGGFASAVGTGDQEDRFSAVGDILDVYRVSLTRNQTIALSIRDFSDANPAANDLDLFLVDLADLANPVASSVDTTATEVVVVPATGEYLIVVSAFSGISNYLLEVGQISANNSIQHVGLRLENEIVSDELIVRFKDRLDIASNVSSLQSSVIPDGLTKITGNTDELMLFRMPDISQRKQALSALAIQPNDKSLPASILLSDRIQEKYETLKMIKKLRARPDVISADPNYLRKPLLVPNDTHYTKQWNYPLINLPQAWDLTTGTPATGDVIVAVVDTGVVLNHPDITNKLVPGFDFIRDNNSANDNEPGIDNNPDDTGDGATPGTSSFHGTHVSGTVGADTNNNSGVSGVSWGAKIMPIRVLGKSGGTSFDVLQGVRYAAGLSNTSNTVPAVKADIINLSLGGGGFSQTEQNTFTEARNAGVIVIAAAGNESSSLASYPAAYDGVISVSAVDQQKQLAPYSNFGSTINIAAPGGDASRDINADGFVDGILSTAANDADDAIVPIFRFYQGTSMASPHVAGVIALMKAVYPELTPELLDEVLEAGSITEDISNDGATARNDSFGYGLIDALKAVQVASDLANGDVLPGALSVAPGFLNFENFLTETTIETSNRGGQEFSIINISVDAPWLQVTPVSIDEHNLGTYKANVSRLDLADGLYTANVIFTTDVAGEISMPVNMVVGNIGDGFDQLGQIWVILVNSVTNETESAIPVNLNDNNEYQYSFGELDSGSYVVFAGTDSDNDGFICDAGEACGAYPTFNQKTDINVSDKSITSLDFFSGFNLIFDAANQSAFSVGEFNKEKETPLR